jgi:hypothetical protein
MPINVTCPGCLTRFSVGDKFAGKQGPCPKCKAVITIPKPTDEVIIHAPVHSEAGAMGVGGRHALKTYKKQDTKFKPLVFAGVAGFVLLAILVALVIRIEKIQPELWMLALAAITLGAPSAWSGYTFLRDDELEGYRGSSQLLRAVICGLVFALLWGVYWFVGRQLFGPDAFVKGMEIWQMAVLLIPVLFIGAGAAYVTFDMDLGSGFFLCGMYFAITVLLRLVAGLPALPGLGGGT